MSIAPASSRRERMLELIEDKTKNLNDSCPCCPLSIGSTREHNFRYHVICSLYAYRHPFLR